MRTEQIHLSYNAPKLLAHRSILRQLFWRAKHEKIRLTQFDHYLRSKFCPHRLLAHSTSVRQYIGAGVAILIALSLYRPLPLAISVSTHLSIHLPRHLCLSQHLFLPFISISLP
jgi:hypothetical protein